MTVLERVRINLHRLVLIRNSQPFQNPIMKSSHTPTPGQKPSKKPKNTHRVSAAFPRAQPFRSLKVQRLSISKIPPARFRQPPNQRALKVDDRRLNLLAPHSAFPGTSSSPVKPTYRTSVSSRLGLVIAIAPTVTETSCGEGPTDIPDHLGVDGVGVGVSPDAMGLHASIVY